MTFCPEHPKRDQNPKFTPLSETTSVPVHSIWESPPLPGRNVVVQNTPCCKQRTSSDWLTWCQSAHWPVESSRQLLNLVWCKQRLISLQIVLRWTHYIIIYLFRKYRVNKEINNVKRSCAARSRSSLVATVYNINTFKQSLAKVSLNRINLNSEGFLHMYNYMYFTIRRQSEVHIGKQAETKNISINVADWGWNNWRCFFNEQFLQMSCQDSGQYRPKNKTLYSKFTLPLSFIFPVSSLCGVLQVFKAKFTFP